MAESLNARLAAWHRRCYSGKGMEDDTAPGYVTNLSCPCEK